MRTTLTLDPDVEALLDEEVHRRREPFKKVVNDVLRRGLRAANDASTEKPYRLVPHKAALRAGLDPGALNRLADELEVDGYLESQRKRSTPTSAPKKRRPASRR